MPTTMNAEVCSIVAQVAPVFLVLFVAERIVVRGTLVARLWTIYRVGLDVLIIALLILLEWRMLLGVQDSGVRRGDPWGALLATILIVTIRFLILDRAVRSMVVAMERALRRHLKGQGLFGRLSRFLLREESTTKSPASAATVVRNSVISSSQVDSLSRRGRIVARLRARG